jgi:hypothetical protein
MKMSYLPVGRFGVLWSGLALLALGGSLFPLPILGLLSFLIMPVASVLCFWGLMRLGARGEQAPQRALLGTLIILVGTVLLFLATCFTPMVFVVDHGSLLRTYRLVVPLRMFFGLESVGPITALSMPVLWLGSAATLVIGTMLRGNISTTTGARLFAMIEASLLACAVLFWLLAHVWPLGV